MRPVACLITDRRRLRDQTFAGVTEQIRSAAAAGVTLVQLRERDLDGGPLFELTRLAVAAVRGTRTRIVVNERLDVALAAGAHGVHLRSDSFAVSRARMSVPIGFLIGRSVHSDGEVDDDAARGADYLLFGTVFDTVSKPGRRGVGVDALAAAANAGPVPVLAVGGMTRDRVGAVMNAGAAGYAGISLFAGGSIS